MPELKIIIDKPAKNLTVLRLSGDFEGQSVLDAKEKLLSEVEQSAGSNMMLDFAGIQYIDSAAVGILLEMMKLAHAKGTQFALIHLNEPVKKVFALTRLDKVIKIYDE